MAEKVRYSDEELEEFRAVILQKLELAKRDYDQIMRALRHEDSNDVADTSPTYKGLEDGSDAAYLEEQMQIASRQAKFIQGLQAALIRIENKTYGICRETGKLIAKERLMAVPHATLSIEAKTNREDLLYGNRDCKTLSCNMVLGLARNLYRPGDKDCGKDEYGIGRRLFRFW